MDRVVEFSRMVVFMLDVFHSLHIGMVTTTHFPTSILLWETPGKNAWKELVLVASVWWNHTALSFHVGEQTRVLAVSWLLTVEVVVQALQYVQENPDEVCPAGWKPGDKSMKPDPKLSKDYFAAI